ncbi:MAG TPA: ribulose-bisphosphate carboxylase large subunit family protein [Verrucomicrobiota bacterium]|nr:ribulose-bisphosphate carboxylase large subunit family protein [Verrucomicrobiota bacterium]
MIRYERWIMPDDVIVAKYRIETCLGIEQVAEAIAGEQSSGTFVRIPGETDELKRRARARVAKIEPLDAADCPALPGGRPPGKSGGPARFQRGEITLEFPFDNVGANLPTLLATVCGNLYELSDHSGCKLLDLELPAAFGEKYPGPQFGIPGTRRLAGVADRPILGTIVKPSVGLSPAQTADLVRTLGAAGIDFIKDDELMANPPHSPLDQRVGAVMRAIQELADQSGKKVMYAVNITDDLEAMLRHHDTVLAAGGTCVMVSLHSVGLPALVELRKRSALPIHGHRNGWGMYTRHPLLGVEYTAWQKLWRLAGADHLHVNGLQNKFWEPDDSVVRSIRACLTPMFRPDDTAMPVVSSGQWGGQAPETYRLTGTTDLMYVAGGGILAHPMGPAAGLRALQQAWEAAVQGIDLHAHAQTHPELRATIARFAKPR